MYENKVNKWFRGVLCIVSICFDVQCTMYLHCGLNTTNTIGNNSVHYINNDNDRFNTTIAVV